MGNNGQNRETGGEASGESSGEELGVDELTATQRVLRDTVFKRWKDERCEEWSDTHKAVGSVDLFAPFLPLTRRSVADVIEAHLRERTRVKRRSTSCRRSRGLGRTSSTFSCRRSNSRRITPSRAGRKRAGCCRGGSRERCVDSRRRRTRRARRRASVGRCRRGGCGWTTGADRRCGTGPCGWRLLEKGDTRRLRKGDASSSRA